MTLVVYTPLVGRLRQDDLSFTHPTRPARGMCSEGDLLCRRTFRGVSGAKTCTSRHGRDDNDIRSRTVDRLTHESDVQVVGVVKEQLTTGPPIRDAEPHTHVGPRTSVA